MSNDKSKDKTGRVRSKNRERKEKQKFKQLDVKRIENTRIRRISRQR